MKTITEKMQQIIIEESDAANHAKRLGLVYAGWGKWADAKTGKITHKSSNGKLIKLGSDTTTHIDTAPDKETIDILTRKEPVQPKWSDVVDAPKSYTQQDKSHDIEPSPKPLPKPLPKASFDPDWNDTPKDPNPLEHWHSQINKEQEIALKEPWKKDPNTKVPNIVNHVAKIKFEMNRLQHVLDYMDKKNIDVIPAGTHNLDLYNWKKDTTRGEIVAQLGDMKKKMEEALPTYQRGDKNKPLPHVYNDPDNPPSLNIK